MPLHQCREIGIKMLKEGLTPDYDAVSL